MRETAFAEISPWPSPVHLPQYHPGRRTRRLALAPGYRYPIPTGFRFEDEDEDEDDNDSVKAV
jgi:hypothetical protein